MARYNIRQKEFEERVQEILIKIRNEEWQNREVDLEELKKWYTANYSVSDMAFDRYMKNLIDRKAIVIEESKSAYGIPFNKVKLNTEVPEVNFRALAQTINTKKS